MKFQEYLVEVDEVLSHLNKDDYNKIPETIKKGISLLKDKGYVWKYDDAKPLNKQNLSRESIVILAYLNMEYLVKPKQKNLLKEIHAYNERQKTIASNSNE